MKMKLLCRMAMAACWLLCNGGIMQDGSVQAIGLQVSGSHHDLVRSSASAHDDRDEYQFDLDVESLGALSSSEEMVLDAHQRLVPDQVEVDAAGSVKSAPSSGLSSDPSSLHGAFESHDTIQHKKIALHGFHYGRGHGFVAKVPIAKGDPMFFVPKSHIMSLETAKHGRIRALLDANPDLPPAIGLALHLLEEVFLYDKSNYTWYLQSLPLQLNSSMYFEQEEMEMLQGSQLLRSTLSRLDAAKTFYEALVKPVTSREAMDPPLFTEEEFTLGNFQWALSIIWSHASLLSDNEQAVQLVPILDSMSICSDCTNDIRSDEYGISMYATKDYAVGEEIQVFLGDRSSTLSMLNHGVTIAPSQHDTIQISIALDPEEPLLHLKSVLLQSLNFSMNDTYTLRYMADQFDLDMLQSLKIKLLHSGEIEKYDVAMDGGIVSLRNEFVFTRTILNACRNLLAKYPTTLEQDEAKLGSDEFSTLSRRQQEILRALIIEKRILQSNIDLAMRQWQELLDLDLHQLDQ